MENEEQRLLEMKKRIERNKQAASEAKGQLRQLKEQLKEEHKISSTAAAKKRLASLDEKNSEDERKIREGVAQLEEDFEW